MTLITNAQGAPGQARGDRRGRQLSFFGIKLGGIFGIIFTKKHGTEVSAVAYLSYTVGCFFVFSVGKGLRVLG